VRRATIEDGREWVALRGGRRWRGCVEAESARGGGKAGQGSEQEKRKPSQQSVKRLQQPDVVAGPPRQEWEVQLRCRTHPRDLPSAC
jgi:hypothetical protein